MSNAERGTSQRKTEALFASHLSGSRAMRMPSSGRQCSPNKEQNDGPDDRQDETSRMKRRTRRRFREQTGDQSTDDRAGDPKHRGHYETEMLGARHDGARDQTNDKTDNDVPDDV